MNQDKQLVEQKIQHCRSKKCGRETPHNIYDLVKGGREILCCLCKRKQTLKGGRP